MRRLLAWLRAAVASKRALEAENKMLRAEIAIHETHAIKLVEERNLHEGVATRHSQRITTLRIALIQQHEALQDATSRAIDHGHGVPPWICTALVNVRDALRESGTPVDETITIIHGFPMKERGAHAN